MHHRGPPPEKWPPFEAMNRVAISLFVSLLRNRKYRRRRFRAWAIHRLNVPAFSSFFPSSSSSSCCIAVYDESRKSFPTSWNYEEDSNETLQRFESGSTSLQSRSINLGTRRETTLFNGYPSAEERKRRGDEMDSRLIIRIRFNEIYLFN